MFGDIYPGCKARVLYAGPVGTIVTVGDRFDKQSWCTACKRNDWWRVEEHPGYVSCSCNLMRLDGHEPGAFDETAYETTPREAPAEDA